MLLRGDEPEGIGRKSLTVFEHLKGLIEMPAGLFEKFRMRWPVRGGPSNAVARTLPRIRGRVEPPTRR